jgi:hypothetical protein
MGEEGPSFSYLQIEKIRSFLHGCLCQHAMASPRAGIDLYPFMAVSFKFLRFGCVMSVWHGLMVVGQETCVCILITPFGIDGSLNPLLKSASISILGMKCRRLNLLQYPFEWDQITAAVISNGRGHDKTYLTSQFLTKTLNFMPTVSQLIPPAMHAANHTAIYLHPQKV